MTLPISQDTKALHEVLSKLPQVPEIIFADEKVVAETGTPEPLGSGVLKNGVLIQAKVTNTQSVYIGNATKQPVELTPGEALPFPASNLDKLYVKVAVDGEGVNYLGG